MMSATEMEFETLAVFASKWTLPIAHALRGRVVRFGVLRPNKASSRRKCCQATYPGRARRRSFEQLVARADVALYDAKAAGRNRVAGWRSNREVRRARLSG